MSIDVSLKDIGPIVEAEFSIKNPGVSILKGSPGSGKTTTLRTIELVANGTTSQKPSKRDGAKTGVASVAGKVLKLSRTTREEGEMLGVEGLGDLDISTLHGPPYKDAVTRDKYRIATLVRLGGVKADESLFYDLVGGEEKFKEIVGDVGGSDLVEMASKVKAAVDRKALAVEKEVQSLESARDARLAQCVGIDESQPHDDKELASALEAAIAAESGLKSQRKSAEKTLADAANARKQLESQELPDVDALKEQADGIPKRRGVVAREIDELKARLQEASEKLTALNAEADSLDKQIASAKQAKASADNWRKAIETAEKVENPTDEELAAATKAVEDSRAAVSEGAKVRQALKSKAEAAEFKAKAESTAKIAEKLRKSAKKTADVISEAIGRIPACPLKAWVNDDGETRLVIATDRSEREAFDDLSDGERWGVTIRQCLSKGRLVTLSQAAWGEISPKNKALIHEAAKEAGAYVLTAEVTDTELACVEFSE